MKCILFAVFIAAIFVSGETRKCYFSITIDASLNTNDSPTECPIADDRCLKSSSGLTNGSELVLRSCIQQAANSSILGIVQNFYKNRTVIYTYNDYCDSDGCNSAQSIMAIFSTILTSLLMSIFVNN